MSKKYLCLRDDDTNYFTTLSELKNGYRELWGNIPITLATIPFVHGSENKIIEYDSCPNKFELLHQWELNANIKELSIYHNVHPIAENIELVDGLKRLIKKNMIEIAQHGVHHRYNQFGAEMEHSNIAINSIESGKLYLEKVFDSKISIFIPPSNIIDNIVMKKMKQLDFFLLCSRPVKFNNMGSKITTFFLNPQDIFDGGLSKVKGGMPIRKRQGIYISDSITFDKDKKDDYIYNLVVHKLDKFGFYSITTHYRLLSDVNYRERYIKIIKKLAKDKTIEFVTGSEYFRKATESITNIKR